MTRALLLTSIAMLTLPTSARAISLVVMAQNTTAIAGDTVYTMGVQVTAADVAAGGPNAVLFVQNITFTGGTAGPVHATAAANKPDVQNLQTAVIDTSASVNSGPPSANLGSVNGNNAFYRDSWWYNSAGGTLQGVIDSAGDTGVVTTIPASDGSGVYTLGASPHSGTNAVGVTGYTFQASGSPGAVPANPTTGQTMTNSGLFGPTGADYWDPSPGGPFTNPNHILGDLLVQNGGTLTVPLAQIIGVNGQFIPVPSNYAAGAGTFLELGTPIYNVLGGPANVDPEARLPMMPEPSSIVMAAMAGLGLIWGARRRVKLPRHDDQRMRSAAPTRRRWFQFSLTSLLIVTTLVALWLAWELSFIRARQAWLAENAALVNPENARAPTGISVSNGTLTVTSVQTPPAVTLPIWRRWLGDDVVATIVDPGFSDTDRAEVAWLFPEAELVRRPATTGTLNWIIDEVVAPAASPPRP